MVNMGQVQTDDAMDINNLDDVELVDLLDNECKLLLLYLML